MVNKVKEFLKESNAIEGVYDSHSLKLAQMAWGFLISQDKLDDIIIKRTHFMLMKGKLKGREIGYYRQRLVHVGGNWNKPWREIPDLMDSWIQSANVATTEKEIKTDHIWYEHIHPFVDGNGRTGRMFMNWQRMKEDLPVLIIKEKEKLEYYKWFKDK